MRVLVCVSLTGSESLKELKMSERATLEKNNVTDKTVPESVFSVCVISRPTLLGKA